MISFIKEGNGTIGDDESHRIAITKSYQNKWLGTKVRALVPFAKGNEGVVRYLGSHDRTEIVLIRGDKGKYHPFWANVKFDNGRSQMVNLSNLEIMND